MDGGGQAQRHRIAERPASIGIERLNREAAAADVSAADEEEVAASVNSVRFGWPQ